jgi:copper chaperone CopZ
VSNTRNHRASREHLQENMSERPDRADSSLRETMVARIKINGLGDPARQTDITEAVEALNSVTETKIDKGALHVSYDPLVTGEKKIEDAIRSTGHSIKAAATETAQRDLATATDVKQTRV